MKEMQSEKRTLRRVRLDRGGYDPTGAYWGVGATLWEYESPQGDTDRIRAGDRDHAKDRIRALHGEEIEFYR